MKSRRAVLGSGASALAAALAGCSGSALTGSGSGSGSTKSGLSGATVRTVDAPGSTNGTLSLPTGGVTVVDVFSTSCAPCVTELKRLRTARAKLLDSVSFVSVTNQVLGGAFTRADLRQWWASHGGDWSVGIDAHGTLDRKLGVTGLPTLAVVDADGSVTWTHEGVASVDRLVAAVHKAR